MKDRVVWSAQGPNPGRVFPLCFATRDTSVRQKKRTTERHPLNFGIFVQTRFQTGRFFCNRHSFNKNRVPTLLQCRTSSEDDEIHKDSTTTWTGVFLGLETWSDHLESWNFYLFFGPTYTAQNEGCCRHQFRTIQVDCSLPERSLALPMTVQSGDL